MASSDFLQPGRLLENRYRILQLLGQGGMGRVYLAEDQRLPGKKWAVKELKPGSAQREQLAQEARVLAECAHPGLAAVTDFIPADDRGVCYLIMEYIQGRTLLQALRQEGAFPWTSVMRLGIELCQVLAYLHEGRPVPIIHRDLKPSNVMLDENGRVKLIDFGTARHYNRGADADTVRLGTMGFAAPEQLLGRQTDARTDLYALGALLNFMLEGGKSPIPDEAKAVIARLLEEDPSQRYQRAEEVEKAIASVLKVEKLPAGLSGIRDSVNPEESKSPSCLWIVVGGLTGGSGATFTAVALARSLHARGLPHTVIELPGVTPDLYHILFGDRHAPKGYRYWAEAAMLEAGRLKLEVEWTSGFTQWAPLAPNRPLEAWNSDCSRKLVQHAARPVAILDIGSDWTDPAHEEILKKAELLLLVCDPSPLHLGRAEAGRNWGRLGKLRQAGKDIGIIANKSADFKGKQEWLESLPSRPLCHIPEIRSDAVLSALWAGRLVADLPGVYPLLRSALEPVTDRIMQSCGIARKRVSVWKRLGLRKGKSPP